jgi:aspartate racemase
MAKKEILGVVGGIGPLASAEFVKTIYERGIGEQEQDAPKVLMHSDPTFPDRTQSLLAGDYEPLLRKLVDISDGLLRLGASRIVICCMTIHHLLPKLPVRLRSRTISLLDVIFEEVAKSPKQRLLICTTGTRKLGVFERHVRWEALKDRIVTPGEEDQRVIHDDIIYQIKRNQGVGKVAPVLESLLLKYGLDSFVSGCTEIHLLAKHVAFSGHEARFGCIDPLMIIAKELSQ